MLCGSNRRISLVAFFASIAISALSTTAGARQVLPGFVVDRLSLVLTGRPADPAIVEQYVTGQLTLIQIADLYKSHPLFEQRLAQFWTERLQLKTPTFWDQISRYNETIRRQQSFADGISAFGMKTLSTTDPTCRNSSYSQGSARSDVIFIKKLSNSPLSAIYNDPVQGPVAGCTCDPNLNAPRPKLIAPWWAPDLLVMTCPATDSSTYCGPNLRNCLPAASSGSIASAFNETSNSLEFWGYVTEGFTMEPGFHIAKTIVEDRSWNEVLTSTESAANAAMLSLLNQPAARWLDANAPPGTYSEISAAQHFSEAIADPRGVQLKIVNDGREFVRYNRGGRNAGILTTPAFILRYNGPRAKINASRQAFLCKSFTVPAGVQQVASDEVDLTKKPYCQICHSVLEPMTKFYAKWPPLGELNYRYDATVTDASATGTYVDDSDVDVPGLASVYTRTEDFKTCAVKRAFEFLVGRQMTTDEEGVLVPQLSSTLTANNLRIWPVMRSIINSPFFSGPTQ